MNTPRTDSLYNDCPDSHGDTDFEAMADLARKLEHDLAKAIQERQEYKRYYEDLTGTYFLE